MVFRYDGGVVANFEIDLQVKTQDLGDYWAASARGLGVTVFADTESAALRIFFPAHGGPGWRDTLCDPRACRKGEGFLARE